MGFVEHGAADWKRDRASFAHWKHPECMKFYSKETVKTLVPEDALPGRFKRYTIEHLNHSNERYYVATIGDEEVCVRGLIRAKFVFLHHFMAE
jgi:hypothetical protein